MDGQSNENDVVFSNLELVGKSDFNGYYRKCSRKDIISSVENGSILIVVSEAQRARMQENALEMWPTLFAHICVYFPILG